ncbi:MAG: ribonuclease D [Pseudomonadota bacterium]
MPLLHSASATNLESHYVETDSELGLMVADLLGEKVVSVDTEFMREKTYYPELCLIQIASSRKAWCVDALSITNLTPLLDALASPKLTKILHSARQDLEIFCLLLNEVPAPIFDTQLAATFTGHPDQISYASLVESMLQVSLDKSQTRTNWAARPLKDAQIAYALNDVFYLLPLKEKLELDLRRQGRYDWFLEDSEQLRDKSIYLVAPDEAWQKVKGVGNLESQAFATLSALAEWRESEAQKVNLPRSWILKDAALMMLAEDPGKSLIDLQRDGIITNKQLKRWQDSVASVLESSRHESGENPYYRARGLDPEQKKRYKKISDFIKGSAAELGINSTLLANRKVMEKLARDRSKSSLLEGWRGDLLRDGLNSIL